MTEPARRDDLGFLLAKASQRWNEVLVERFAAKGFPEVRPAYGSVLLPLFEEDGLRMGELARRALVSKQTMTSLVRRVEAAGLVERRVDPGDLRASPVFLTERARVFAPVAARVLDDLQTGVATLLAERQLRSLKRSLRRLLDLS